MRRIGLGATVLALLAATVQAKLTSEQASQLQQMDALLAATMKHVGGGPRAKKPMVYWIHRKSKLKSSYVKKAQAGAVVWSSAPGLGATLQAGAASALKPLCVHPITQGVGELGVAPGPSEGRAGFKRGPAGTAVLFGNLPSKASALLGVPGQGAACAVLRQGQGWIVFVPEATQISASGDGDRFWYNLKRWTLEQTGLWAGTGPTEAGKLVLAGGQAGKQTAGRGRRGRSGKYSPFGSSASSAGKTTQGLGKKVTLSLKDEDLLTVVQQIAQQAGVSIKAYTGRRPKVSLELKDADLEEALNALCSRTGLHWREYRRVYYLFEGEGRRGKG